MNQRLTRVPQQCDTCKHWEAKHVRRITGRCRRFPPHPYHGWTETEQGDWCGEHSPMPGTPEAEDA